MKSHFTQLEKSPVKATLGESEPIHYSIVPPEISGFLTLCIVEVLSVCEYKPYYFCLSDKYNINYLMKD